MFNWFKRKKVNSDPNFNEVHFSELDSIPNGIDNLQNKEVDGFLIRSVLNSEEVKALLDAYNAVPEGEIKQTTSGMFVYPSPFSMVDKLDEDDKSSLKTFFHDAEVFWNDFTEKFNFDFVQRITDVLIKIGGNRSVKVPSGIENIGIYNPATIRYLVPNEGEFNVHCGNYFHKEFPNFYDHMNSISVIENQMSYFVVLQKPEVGGELVVYDLTWDEAETRLGGVIKTKSGKELNLSNPNFANHIKLSPNAGDMIVFSGGRIWHKVEKPQGSFARITMGGFLSRSRDDRELYIWS